MAKNVFSGFRSAGHGPVGHSRARRRVTTWAALGILALLATLLTPLSTASAQTEPTAPAAPTIATPTPGDGTVTLTWSLTAGGDNGSTIIRWEYTQSTPATNVWVPIPGSDRNTARYTVTGLRNGTEYAFQVRAVNGEGNGEESTESTGVTPSTTPAAPVGLRGTAGNSEVTLAWTAAVVTGGVAEGQNDGFSPILRYEYRQKIGDGDYAPWAIMVGSDATTATYDVTGLTNGNTYQFQVRAVNMRGAGASSETRPVTIATAPGRPRSLTAVPGNKQVALSWTASSDGGSPITSWQFRQIDGTGTFVDLTDPAWVTIPGSNADTTSYTVTALDNDEVYTFEVRAVNAEGAGTPARSAQVDPGMPPGRPTGLQGAADASSVTLSWIPPLDVDDALVTGGSPILRYEYSQKTGDGDYGEWTAIPANALFTTNDATDRTLTNTAAVAGTATAAMGHTVRGLTAGTAYEFRVRAVNATGAGEPATISRPVFPGTKPPAPANFSARPVYDAASGRATITLSWASGGDGGSPITKWQYKTATTLATLGAADTAWVDICDNTTGQDPTCASTTTVDLPRSLRNGQPDPRDGTTDDPGLIQAIATGLGSSVLTDDEHHFVVRAVNARDDGFQSGTDSARFAPAVPSAPRAVHIQAVSDTAVTVAWLGSVAGGSAVTRYEYSVKAGSGSYGPWVANPAPTDLTVAYTVPTGTQRGTPLTFRVRGVNQIGNGTHTESATIPWGAPPTPGAAALTVVGCPALVAAPGSTQVTLSLLAADGSTPCATGDGTAATTRWEYSYKVGDEEYGSWTFSNVGTALTVPDEGVIDGLENGMPHTFRVRALNGPLSSPILEARPTTPGVAPPAPQGLTASAADKQVTLSWTSAGSGGPPITEWEYCISGHIAPTPVGTAPTQLPPADSNTCAVGDGDGAGGWTDVPGGPDASEHTVSRTDPTDTTTGLINGNSYTFRVRARNAIGGGALAEANAATPGRTPTAPVRVVVDEGDGRVTIRVDAPSNNNGSAVVGYQVRKRIGDGPFDAWESLGTTGRAPSAASAGGAAVTGLVNGASYTFQVRAVNGFGPGTEIEYSSAAIPVGPPAAGELGAAAGDGQVVLTWAPESSVRSGGSSITKWQYRQSESGGGYGAWADIADSGPATVGHTVTGLSNGISYTFQVRAVNQQGNAEPITSAAVTPSTVPPAPSVSAERGNGQIDLTWTAGTSGAAGEANYAAPTTGWQVQVDDGAWTDIADSGADTTSHSVTGLTNGTAYTLSVRAVNSQGGGAAGSADPVTPATTPSAPELSAERGDGSVMLSWTAGDDGGSAVTAWHLQVNDGEWVDLSAQDVAADATSHTVTGLDNGTAYTFGVRAANDVGDGAAGTASATPATTPSAPEVTATAGDGTVTLTWTAGDDGGSAITTWHLQVNGGDWTDLSAFGLGPDTRAVPVPSLDNGTAYTFGVRAANDVGNGAAGEATATPATTPAEPTVTAVGSSGEITVSWTAGDDGGSAVTAWHYRMRFGAGDYGDWNEASADTTSVTVDGLDTGTGVLTYTFEVRAVNGIGEGATGTSNDAVPAMASPENGVFYSGVIDGPDFCTNFSLGGAHLIAHDSDDDGVADVCSLPYTRREAIARQSAVEALAVQQADTFRALVNAACGMVEGDGDCGGDMLVDPPAVPINNGGPFYSGIITGPSFCANRSLGGSTTYPHDSDGDGVSDVCALPYTRREAIARQIAGDTLAAMSPSDFRRELASACRGLTGADYGDDPAHLADDACA